MLVVKPALQTKITLVRISFKDDIISSNWCHCEICSDRWFKKQQGDLSSNMSRRMKADTSWLVPTLLGLVLSTMPVSLFKLSRALVCFAFTFLAAAAADFVAALLLSGLSPETLLLSGLSPETLLLSGLSPESSIPMLLQWDMLSECILGPITLI